MEKASNLNDLAALVSVPGVPNPLAYALGEHQSSVNVGAEVKISLGKRSATGWVVELITKDRVLEELRVVEELRVLEKLGPKPAKSQLSMFNTEQSAGPRDPCDQLKVIQECAPAFNPQQLELFQWMASYYGYQLSEILDNAIPTRTSIPLQQVALLNENGHALYKDAEQYAALCKRAPLQGKVIEHLHHTGDPVSISELQVLGSSVRSAVTSLQQKGLIEVREELPPLPIPSSTSSEAGEDIMERQLSAHQAEAAEAIKESINCAGFSSHLLFGVTGSGKTEVYIQAIEHALSCGKSALVVVPEISLTPQLVDRFQERFKDPIAVLHSQVGRSLRWRYWDEARRGKVHIAVGARSAIFAPLQNLGLIIVDEEHEQSYKQSDGIRYHARDVAVMRAKLESCAVVLGSATPSFETMINARKKRYKLLEMPERVTTRPVPTIEVVDLKQFKKKEMPSENISPTLHQAMAKTLDERGQVVILFNKRGFSSFLQCDTCGEAVKCHECSVSMTYHKNSHKLVCHHCGISHPAPNHCASCRDPRTTRIDLDDEGLPIEKESTHEKVGKLSHRGSGTERVSEEIASLFPTARILRMDRDTVSKKDSYREILDAMRRGEADILVGTQMIAKGHDLPGVTLVGVIDADIGLHLPDFRSSEKVFQLITQAAGRAGRGEQAGRVLVQTREPKHPTIVATSTGRFRAFARYELQFRKQLRYPPFGRLLRVIVSCPDPHDARNAAKEVAECVRQLLEQAKEQGKASAKLPSAGLLGPAPAPYEKLRGRYRWHLMVKTDSAPLISSLASTLHLWRKTVKGYRQFRLTIDVDPVEML